MYSLGKVLCSTVLHLLGVSFLKLRSLYHATLIRVQNNEHLKSQLHFQATFWTFRAGGIFQLLTLRGGGGSSSIFSVFFLKNIRLF